jgi:dolichyl-phosphate beta-glucosyltransferase
MTARSLTIVLPAYNEAERIGPALDELLGYLEGLAAPGAHASSTPGRLGDSVQVLVVDDGSTDTTVELVRSRAAALGEPAAVITLDVLSIPHGGKGAAVRAGMLAATGDVVVFADADMATPPDMLPRLLAALERSDIALGSRIQPDGSDMRKTQPRYRRALGALFHLFASAWAVGPVQDTQCGFKGFTRAAAQDLFRRQKVTSIVFDVELIYLARRRGYHLAIVPIEWADRRGSRMRARPALAMRVGWDLLRIPLIHRGVSRASGGLVAAEARAEGSRDV